MIVWTAIRYALAMPQRYCGDNNKIHSTVVTIKLLKVSSQPIALFPSIGAPAAAAAAAAAGYPYPGRAPGTPASSLDLHVRAPGLHTLQGGKPWVSQRRACLKRTQSTVW